MLWYYRWIDQMHGYFMDKWIKRQIEGWKVGQLYGQINEQMDRQREIYRWIERQIVFVKFT